MTVTQIITAICPSLAASASVDIFVQMATDQTSSDYFGTNYTKAIALRAAHEFTLAQRVLGESGTVASKSEGGLSMGFSSSGGMPPTAMSSDLDQTHYGLQLKSLIASQTGAMTVIGADDELVDSTQYPYDPYARGF